uniref:Uncharacterized protein n=1 Tax=Cannabis sativa TaxID=3483 RepID=A0A803PRB2_CANSA
MEISVRTFDKSLPNKVDGQTKSSVGDSSNIRRVGKLVRKTRAGVFLHPWPANPVEGCPEHGTVHPGRPAIGFGQDLTSLCTFLSG